MPRQINPSPAAMRAAKVIQELVARANQDTQGRLAAEQKLVEAYGEIQELRRQLNEASNTNTNDSARTVSDTTDAISEPEAKV